jgi:diguanylate cyclase (GGDEF)-like protein/PAS domain S-box-containing protein
LEAERILIVEDEKIIAFDLQRRLSSFGYNVVDLCTQGQEALEAATAHRPDLVLMDIMLEGSMDGIEASTQIQNRLGIPSVFLTAYSDENTLERAKNAKPLGYILKPFKERDLYSTLDIALYKAQLDKKLGEQKRWSDAILQSVNDGILALDLEDNIYFANPTALMLLDIRQDEILGRNPRDVFSLTDEESHIPIRFPMGSPESEATAREIQIRSAKLETKSGMVYHVEGRVSQLRLHNLRIGQMLVFRDVSSMKILREKVEHQAKHDPLTGLVNRREMNKALTRIIAESKGKELSHSILYFDLDQFKLINDTCGHLAGDELLRKVADIIRNLNFTNMITAARFGGDEFALLFQDTDVTQALEKAWMLKHSLSSQTFVWKDDTFPIKASIGVIPVDEEFQDEKSVWAAADDACYLAKEGGGNKIKVFEPQSEEFQKRRGEMRWISRLTEAIKSNHFALYYQSIQPVVEDSGLKTKWELLLRLIESDGTVISPFDFIPAAERYNLMPAIDQWVIRNAFQYRKKMNVNQETPVFSINLSGESIADPNFISFIKHELSKNELSPECFVFEITETATITNLEQAMVFIEELREIGCKFALDDFGSGLSSFGYLQNLPVDFLKIDGNFIKNIQNDPVHYAMVEALGKISKVMGLQTIAEFVAEKEILETLQTIGIDFAQGYYLSQPKPLPPRP